jgi:hypothetical protein
MTPRGCTSPSRLERRLKSELCVERHTKLRRVDIYSRAELTSTPTASRLVRI